VIRAVSTQMPELPDITVYVEALHARLIGHKLIRTLVRSPFLLRSAHPPLSAANDKMVRGVRRLGQRIAIGLEGGIWLVVHLKIAGRLHWKTSAAKLGTKNALASFEFDWLEWADNEVVVEVGYRRRFQHQFLERADDERRLATARNLFYRGRLLRERMAEVLMNKRRSEKES